MDNKNALESNNEKQYTCSICEKTFTSKTNLTKHNRMHTIQKVHLKRKKRNQYCKICCRNYASAQSFYYHMKRTHDESKLETVIATYTEQNNTLNSKKNINHLDIFTEFKNKLPPELKYNKNRCNICHFISVNLDEHIKHENSHYQLNSINKEDIHINHENENNEDIQLNHENENSNNNKNLKMNIWTPSTSKDSFTLQYNDENHLEDTHLAPKDCDNELSNSRHKIKQPNQDHMTALKIVKDIKPFKCEICNGMCELPEHFEIYGWFN